MNEKKAPEGSGIPKMLRIAAVEAITGLSAVTLWRMERDGQFPRRRRLFGSTVGWREDEVRAWVESREPVPIPAEGP
jgi:prophage regulatory protein